MSGEIATPQHTKPAVFEPTIKMKEYVIAAVELGTNSPTKIEQNSALARRTWYDWVKLPGFEDWFYNEYSRLRRRIIPELDELTMKYAKRGSFQHLELMTKKVGDLPQEAPTHATQINIQPLLGGESIKNVPSNNSNQENTEINQED
jgi:hypothetical protein